MSDPGPRKRKKASSKPTAKPTQNEPSSNDLDVDFSSFQKYAKIIWIPFLVAFGIFIYLNPRPVAQLANSWLGEDSWQPSSRAGSRVRVANRNADIPKRDAVVEAFKYAWRAYERDAMGSDEYHPISRNGSNLTDTGGIGYTVIDSIDTMLIMGLDDDYARARTWVADKLSFETNGSFNTFETTIRVLGGLLSAYHISGEDPLYLERAVDLADRLLPVFDTPTGLPLPMVNLVERKGIPDKEFPLLVSTAEVSTLQLEFRYLSFLTDNEIYWEKAENVMKVIKAAKMPHGLASIFMSLEGGQFVPSAIRLGSRGDSYYEYLLKQYLQTNRTEDVYREMYDITMQGIHQYLIQKSASTKMVYTAELIPERNQNNDISWRLTPKQDHLVCFIGGSLMLGATTTGALFDTISVPPRGQELTLTGLRDWKSGAALIKTCMDTHDTATGLAPEIVHFRIPSDGMDQKVNAPSDWYIKGARPGAFPPYDARYMLRPETVESLFLAYRLSGDKKYRDYGWSIFQSIEKYCKVETGGYATIVNVDEVPVRLEDKMETFLMSETLKYLYLLFDDADVLPLDEYVFNTEAHPLPIFNPTIRTGFS
ncbi:related to alpha-mannosidase [Armillaria ostoyae]|uniref:alpha-1,2-Mannosidase n=1 Tax=Armillaria ostoyae TaxID=47428 RepID=A0A284RHP7_ARMOS|nr:related to alpha-mannosidase [Armillaria ostoyae]